jgi:hypothetical protein
MAAARCVMGIQHRVELRAAQIGKSHDSRTRPRLTVSAARRQHRDGVHHLGFTDRAERHRPSPAVHSAALHEHGRDDVVAAHQIDDQLLQQIAPRRTIVPQMVVRIDDRQFGFDDVLAHLVEPGGAHDRMVIVPLLDRDSAHGHCLLIPDATDRARSGTRGVFPTIVYHGTSAVET